MFNEIYYVQDEWNDLTVETVDLPEAPGLGQMVQIVAMDISEPNLVADTKSTG